MGYADVSGVRGGKAGEKGRSVFLALLCSCWGCVSGSLSAAIRITRLEVLGADEQLADAVAWVGRQWVGVRVARVGVGWQRQTRRQQCPCVSAPHRSQKSVISGRCVAHPYPYPRILSIRVSAYPLYPRIRVSARAVYVCDLERGDVVAVHRPKHLGTRCVETLRVVPLCVACRTVKRGEQEYMRDTETQRHSGDEGESGCAKKYGIVSVVARGGAVVARLDGAVPADDGGRVLRGARAAAGEARGAVGEVLYGGKRRQEHAEMGAQF